MREKVCVLHCVWYVVVCVRFFHSVDLGVGLEVAEEGLCLCMCSSDLHFTYNRPTVRSLHPPNKHKQLLKQETPSFQPRISPRTDSLVRRHERRLLLRQRQQEQEQQEEGLSPPPPPQKQPPTWQQREEEEEEESASSAPPSRFLRRMQQHLQRKVCRSMCVWTWRAGGMEWEADLNLPLIQRVPMNECHT